MDERIGVWGKGQFLSPSFSAQRKSDADALPSSTLCFHAATTPAVELADRVASTKAVDCVHPFTKGPSMLLRSQSRRKSSGKNDRYAGYRRIRRLGIAATEFAVVAPFVGVLIMGMCEMGRTVMVKDILTNAARKGCRTAVTTSKTYADLQSDVNNILSDNGMTPSDATITVKVASYTGTSTTPSWGSFTTVTSSSFSPKLMDQVSVKVSIPVAKVLWFTPTFMDKATVKSEVLIMVRQG
jgi:Flp pilus assembly protein TadG